MLRTVARDADGIGFLKGIGADQRCGHLPGDHDQRDGVHIGIGNAGDGIGRARAAGDQNHAGLAGAARIPFCRMGRACFMTHEDMANAVVTEQLVIDRQNGTAGIAENEFHTLRDKAVHEDGGPAAPGSAVAGVGVLGGHVRLSFK